MRTRGRRVWILLVAALVSAVAVGMLLSGCGKPSTVSQPTPPQPSPGATGAAPAPSRPAAPAVSLLGKTLAESDLTWGRGVEGSRSTTKTGAAILMYSYKPTAFHAVSAGFVDDRLVVAAFHLRKPARTIGQALSAVGLNPKEWKATSTPGFPYVPTWRWNHQPAPSPDAPAQTEFRRDKSGAVTRVKVFSQRGVESITGTRALGPRFPK